MLQSSLYQVLKSEGNEVDKILLHIDFGEDAFIRFPDLKFYSRQKKTAKNLFFVVFPIVGSFLAQKHSFFSVRCETERVKCFGS